MRTHFIVENLRQKVRPLTSPHKVRAAAGRSQAKRQIQINGLTILLDFRHFPRYGEPFSPVQSEAGMRSVFLVPILIVVLIFTSTAAGLAQITSATISGTIKDQTGAVLPGADVVVKNVDTGLTRSIVTDANGYFTVPGLPPGTYETRATLQGFGIAVERVTLAVAQEA